MSTVKVTIAIDRNLQQYEALTESENIGKWLIEKLNHFKSFT